MLDDPFSVLQGLRWRVNSKVVTPLGDYVWLKPCVSNGQRIGITDCCQVSFSCDYHRKLQAFENAHILN